MQWYQKVFGYWDTLKSLLLLFRWLWFLHSWVCLDQVDRKLKKSKNVTFVNQNYILYDQYFLTDEWLCKYSDVFIVTVLLLCYYWKQETHSDAGKKNKSAPRASWLMRRHIAQLCSWRPEFDSRLEVLCRSRSPLSIQCFPVDSLLYCPLKA